MVNACGLFSKDKPPPPPEPTRVVLEFEAAGKINPNIAGRSSPVVVRIYQLKSYSVFHGTDFIPLFEKDEEVLGRELLHKQELILRPNEKRTVFFETSDKIRTIGIMAAFRNYEQGRWKAAAGIQKNKTNVFNVFISGIDMNIK
jgi:type VI secretion system protein VasD